MPAIYHEGSWLGNATDPEVLVKDTVGWTGKNRAYSQTNNAVIAHIENGITYDVSWTGSATVTLKKNSTSGATITSGSTSPLSFTADADYELYFGSSATVTNIMVKDSRITDPTYEPYHESVEEEIEQIYADNGVLGAKNLLPNRMNNGTNNGITFSVNADGSFSMNGTVSSSSDVSGYYICNDFKLSNGNYIFSTHETSDGRNIHYFIAKMLNGSYVSSLAEIQYNDNVPFTINYDDTYDSIRVAVWIRRGTTINNKTAYPMIRLASDPDDTYQPYAMTNRELTEEKINIADLKTVVSASSDFADFKTRIASL